jgi:hypothetical protein
VQVRLVWANCLAYTPDPASPYHQSAKRLQKVFEDGLAAIAKA